MGTQQMLALNARGNESRDRGPIFIGGGDRSGKTLLRFMLSAHPNLSLTRRVNMWPNFYNRYGDLADGINFERCLDAMLQYKHVRLLNPDPDRIRREFWQGPQTYARLFALFQEHHAEREGKPRWGDQTGYVERYADPIFAAYPNARMIHMIRDPRDRYEASLLKSSRGIGRVGVSTADWRKSIDLARCNQEKYSSRYKVIRYEVMVSRPEETLLEVCGFIGEQYTPEMLLMQDIPRFQKPDGHKDGERPNPLSTKYIGRYRMSLSKSDIAFIQMFAKHEMYTNSYSIQPITFSLSEGIYFYLFSWPINFLSFLTCRVNRARQYDNSNRAAGRLIAKISFNRLSGRPSRTS